MAQSHFFSESSLLWNLWLQKAREFSQEPAVIEADTGLVRSFGELASEAWEKASLLPLLPPGTCVAFCEPNGCDWIVRFLACQARGWAALPLDPALPAAGRLGEAASLGAHYLWEGSTLHPTGAVGALQKKAALVKVSSGTMGKPRAIAFPPERLLADVAHILWTMGVRREDRNLALLPLGHSYGLGNLVLPLITAAIPMVSAREFLPSQIPKWIRQYRITVFPSVPAVFRSLARLPDPVRLEPLRLAISAGAPLAPEVARAFCERFGLVLHNFYGATETGGIAFDSTGEASLQGRGVGRPLLGVAVRFLRNGRVQVKSPAVAGRCAWCTLPDLGRWNSHGEIELLGRADRLVNVGGRKLWPAELEAVLRGLPGITDAWVGTEEGGQGKRPRLVAVLESSLPLEKVIEGLRRQIPEWKLPQRLLLVPELPRTSRGKVDRRKLEQLVQAEQGASPISEVSQSQPGR
jgi:acyl-CoA synthetase (AMP-forming)/AMP-acid ligase II